MSLKMVLKTGTMPEPPTPTSPAEIEVSGWVPIKLEGFIDFLSIKKVKSR